jgi:hypothetical protein
VPSAHVVEQLRRQGHQVVDHHPECQAHLDRRTSKGLWDPSYVQHTSQHRAGVGYAGGVSHDHHMTQASIVRGKGELVGAVAGAMLVSRERSDWTAVVAGRKIAEAGTTVADAVVASVVGVG